MGEENNEAKKRRRSERLYLTIPIRVFATDAHGRDFCEDALTVIVSRHGGRIRIQNPLVVDDEIQVTNLSNRKEARFRVVGRVSDPGPDNPFADWGVECLEPEKNIWEVQFRDSPEDALAAGALLECCSCTNVASIQITDEEMDTLEAAKLISRPCSRCRQATLWKFTSTDRRKQEVIPTEQALAAAGLPQQTIPPATPALTTLPVTSAPSAPLAEPVAPVEERRSGADRRQERRPAMRVPIRVRAPDGTVEVTKTENLSKTGARFHSEKNYSVGMTLFVAVPYTPGEEALEMKAVVEDVEELPGSAVKLYGINISFGGR